MAVPKPVLTDFTIIAADLVSNAIIAELPGQDLTFGSRYQSSQPFSFGVPLGDKKLQKIDVANATRPGQTCIYVDYKGKLVFGGIIWGRSYTASTGVISLTGSEILSFYDAQNIPVTLVFAGIDQFEIFRQIVASITALPGGNIGLSVQGGMSGVLRDRTYYWFDFKVVSQALIELANVIGGFDMQVLLQYDSNHSPSKTLVLGYPRIGVVGGGQTRLFDFPGNLNDYTWPEDATGFVTTMKAIGMGEGDQMLVGTASNPDLITRGFPRFDGSYSYKDVSVQATLNAHASQDLANNEHMFKAGTFNLQVDSDPEFGTYNIGDDGRFRITSDFHPAPVAGGAGIDEILRIFGWTVNASTGEVQIEAGFVLV